MQLPAIFCFILTTETPIKQLEIALSEQKTHLKIELNSLHFEVSNRNFNLVSLHSSNCIMADLKIKYLEKIILTKKIKLT